MLVSVGRRAPSVGNVQAIKSKLEMDSMVQAILLADSVKDLYSNISNRRASCKELKMFAADCTKSGKSLKSHIRTAKTAQTRAQKNKDKVAEAVQKAVANKAAMELQSMKYQVFGLDFETLMAEGVVERVKEHDAEDDIDGLIDPACPALLCDHSGVVKEWIQKKSSHFYEHLWGVVQAGLERQ